MDIILGIDIGASNTKIAALDYSGDLCSSLLLENNYRNLEEEVLRHIDGRDYSISKIALTGVGSHGLEGSITDISPYMVNEFTAIGLGGLYLSGRSEAVIASMGTGTAFVYGKDGHFEHIIGTGVGGGTLLGLGGKLTGAADTPSLEKIAAGGDLGRVDLTIGDIAQKTLPSLPANLTASNFAGIKPDARDSDLALGTMNLVLQVVGTMSILACMSRGTKNIVLTGAMTSVSLAEPSYRLFSKTYGYNFVIPRHAAFATAVGAALECAKKF